MQQFAKLFRTIDATTKTSGKVAALVAYFTTAPDADKLWVIALFTSRRLKRIANTTQLRAWASACSGLPLWLIEDSYAVTGDLAETIALVLPPATNHDTRSLSEWLAALGDLQGASEQRKHSFVVTAWDHLDGTERFLFNKLLTGGFRVGVSGKLVTRALSEVTGTPETELTHRLMGSWTPQNTTYHSLIHGDDPASAVSRPYPFQLANGLDGAPAALGELADWHAEWKWDGIRGQIILREGHISVWSRGEELMSDRFPEFTRLLDVLPSGTVLDGEILVWRDDAPQSFNALQNRIGRKTVPRKVLSDAPVVLYAYDLLEWQSQDIRAHPFAKRRDLLEQALRDCPSQAPIRLSPMIEALDWDALAGLRADARARHAEGVMLKDRSAPYVAGRKKGMWWKWKLDPLTIDAVMIYAQSGSGRRANLFTDYTFAVRDGDGLVPFAKAYSGLSDAEFRAITAWVRKNTLQKFGPVRQVTPEHVFEIAFEGIQASTRHKSGVALRFPRMLRWRHDKSVQDANTLDDLKGMLDTYG